MPLPSNPPRVIARPEAGISSESYYAGVEATLAAMKSDEVYYGLDLKPGQYAVVQDVANYLAAGVWPS